MNVKAPPADKSTDELIQDVVRSSHRLRVTASVFMGIVATLLISLIVAQFWQLQEYRRQSTERAEGIRRLSEAAANNSEVSNRYLQCIARFFATTDRASRTLTDLDACTYEVDGQSVPGLDTRPTSTASGQSPAPQTQNQTPQTNTQPGVVPGTPEPEEPAPEQPPADPRPPIEVLGIPVCVPLTNVCVRQ